jgi:GAF domain-containing protein
MAIPIILEGEVVGVLDVQDDEVAGLGEDDASLLRSLVNQVVVAIRNARQFEQVKNALAEAQALQAQYLVQAWDKSKLNRFTSAQAEVRFAGAASSGQEAELGPVLTAPIEFRQITIGHLELEDANPQRVWSPAELALVNAVVEQVAQTAETLRLFEETRERAAREATIREITDKLRAAPTLDRLLETAARELGTRLGVRHTVLEMGVEAGATQAVTPQN